MILWELSKFNDVVLKLPSPHAAFCDTPRDGAPCSQPVLDAALVDDKALVLVAKTPRALDPAIDALLKTVFVVFDCLHLHLNASPGKTEALLLYLGKSATARREARRGPDGLIRLTVLDRDVHIRVVADYKHLGTYTSLVAGDMGNVRHRASSTMQAYGPLSYKIFGSDLVCVQHKILFARAFLLSRLLFGVHVLTLTPRQLKHLNDTYMVALRRIAGELRFSRVAHIDREIREQFEQPALDCIIARMRLIYRGLLARVRPAALSAVLHARPGGQLLQWVVQVARDTEFVRPFMPCSLGSFLDAPDEWYCIMLDKSAWHTVLSRVHFCASVCDRVAHTSGPASGEAARAFESDCGAAFASQRAVASHQRTKHGMRQQI